MRCLSADATTTVAYLDSAGSSLADGTRFSVAGATTTLACSSGSADQIDLNVQYTPSSTAAILLWNYEFSDDGVNWYNEAATSASVSASTTLVTVAGATTTYAWRPGETGDKRKNIAVTPMASKFFRVNFSTNVNDGALWSSVVTRNRGN